MTAGRGGVSRRRFGALTGAGLLAGVLPAGSRRQAALAAAARVVVVGGGVGGATAAKWLALSGAGFEVTLVEPNARYLTPFFSNLFLGDLREIEALTHDYAALAGRPGVRLVEETAVELDPVARRVGLASGATLSYDRAILAPGIGFRTADIEGYGPEAAACMPHAWGGAAQLVLLKRQLSAMENGGLVVITVPRRPFRCPPAPYERAAMIGRFLKRHKPDSKVLVLDANESMPLQELFLRGWERYAPGMIEWLPSDFTGGGLRAVDACNRTVMTEDDSFAAAVANVIPPQRAADIAVAAGLADDSGWCPVHPPTMESRLQPGVHLVGDAIAASPMPKSGFAAHHQAIVAAGAVIAALTGAANPLPPLDNACWSFLAADNVVRLRSRYEIRGEEIVLTEGFVSDDQESDATRAAAAREAQAWYDDFTDAIFG